MRFRTAFSLRPGPLVADIGRDLRYAARTLRRSSVFSVVAILTVALGIGATTAIFSVVDGVLLRPLPYPDPDALVTLGTRSLRTGREVPRLTGGDLADLHAERAAFQAFSAYWGGEVGVQVAGGGQFVGTCWVEPSFFRVFGIPLVAGRAFADRDGGRYAVVSEAFADRTFGSAVGALGGRVSVEGEAYEVAGVLPRGFDAPKRTELWLPVPPGASGPARNRTAFNFQAVARLAPGVGASRAQAAVDTVASRLAASYPDSNRDRGFSVVPLRERLVGTVKPTLVALLGAVAIVLLIACVNVANLLLARSTTRTQEIAMRGALGASRWRIVRQLLTESALLGACGGLTGVVLAVAGTRALVALAPESLPRLADVRVDWRVMAFAAGCSMAASVVFGLAPAWKASRGDLNTGIRQGASRGAVGGRSPRLRHALVVAELALAFALGVGGTLLVRSLIGLTRTDLGFDSRSVLVMAAHRPAATKAEYVETARFFSTLGAEVASLPGVRRAGVAMGVPTGQYGSNGSYEIEGRPAAEAGQDRPAAGFALAGPGYFAAMSVPLAGGRDFDARDRYDSAFVAIVSRALAREQFPGEDPIGRRIRCGLDAPDTWMTIVGVVGDVRQQSPGTPAEPQIYMPLAQHPYFANEVQVVLRTTVPPASVAPALRARMRTLSPETALKFTTLQEMVAATVATARFRALLFGSFAGLALLLSMAGVYGVMAFVAVQRRAEFGVRLALGASRGRVFRQVVGQAIVLAAEGLALGAVLAYVAGRLLGGMLFGLEAGDASTRVAVAILLAIVVLGAAAFPAWRASRVDPVSVLERA